MEGAEVSMEQGQFLGHTVDTREVSAVAQADLGEMGHLAVPRFIRPGRGLVYE